MGATPKLYKRYKTPQNTPMTTQCRRIFVPDDERVISAVNELISLLTNPDIWDDRDGGITAIETAEIMATVWNDFRTDNCL